MSVLIINAHFINPTIEEVYIHVRIECMDNFKIWF